MTYGTCRICAGALRFDEEHRCPDAHLPAAIAALREMNAGFRYMMAELSDEGVLAWHAAEANMLDLEAVPEATHLAVARVVTRLWNEAGGGSVVPVTAEDAVADVRAHRTCSLAHRADPCGHAARESLAALKAAQEAIPVALRRALLQPGLVSDPVRRA